MTAAIPASQDLIGNVPAVDGDAGFPVEDCGRGDVPVIDRSNRISAGLETAYDCCSEPSRAASDDCNSTR
jgi:hypothetical protein